MKLVIKSCLPTLNEYINACRRNKYAGAGVKKRAENLIINQAIQQKLEPYSEGYPAKVSIRWIRTDLRTDPDNIAAAKKFILDALVRGKFLAGDSAKYIVEFSDTFGTENAPRIEVDITPQI